MHDTQQALPVQFAMLINILGQRLGIIKFFMLIEKRKGDNDARHLPVYFAMLITITLLGQRFGVRIMNFTMKRLREGVIYLQEALIVLFTCCISSHSIKIFCMAQGMRNYNIINYLTSTRSKSIIDNGSTCYSVYILMISLMHCEVEAFPNQCTFIQ